MAVDEIPTPDPQPAHGVQPQPTPYTLRMSEVEAAGGVKLTRVEFALVTGSMVIFADAEWLDRLAQAFTKHASMMRQGQITIAGADALRNLQPPDRGMRP